MNTEFPKSTNKYLKASLFQDQEIPLKYLGWEKKANEDRKDRNGNIVSTWKQNLKYVLRYSYPEIALDEAGEKIIKDGKPLVNSNWDPKYPKGYTIVYHFEEGQLESGSLPLFNAFCLVQPKSGDMITISRTGLEKETKWKVKKVSGAHAQTSGEDLPVIQQDEDVPPGSEEWS